MKLRILIADDESLGRERLRLFLQAETDTDLEVVAECANGVEAVKAIRHHSPDLVFLDIKMPELDGFGVLEALNDVPLPAIIFVTAYDQFAVKAFETNAVDYLLKPFDQDRFRTAFDRARERLQSEKGRSALLTEMLASLPSGESHLERVTVKSGKRICVVKTTDIDWVRAADNYTELHVGTVTHLLRMTIGALAPRLPSQFVRVSRSLLVNMTRINEIRSKSHGDFLIILEDGTELSASRSHRQAVMSLLNNSR